MMGKAWRELRLAVHRWWHGVFVEYENDVDSALIFFGGTTERHWTSRVAHAIMGFMGREWKWVAGFVLAVASLCIGLARLP